MTIDDDDFSDEEETDQEKITSVLNLHRLFGLLKVGFPAEPPIGTLSKSEECGRVVELPFRFLFLFSSSKAKERKREKRKEMEK